MKKYSIEELENSEILEEKTEEGKGKDKKPTVSFSRKKAKRKKIKRIVISSLIVLILAGLGWFGFIGYNSLKKIFNGENPSLLTLFNPKELKGESSGRVNILLLGVGDKGHEGENLSDTIMVISLNTQTNDVAMISVPRDLYVKIDSYGYSKINAAHAYGELYKYSGGGPQLAMDTVSKVINQPIQYYARVDFTGFKSIIDAVGGVEINVEKDLYDPLYPGKTVNIKKGQQHMNGVTALQYARSRETTSDFDRAKRQQQVLIAVKEKVLSTQTLLNPKKMSDIIQILGDHIKTNFQLWEGQRLVEISKKVDTSKIINKVFDNSATGLLINDSSAASGYILIPRLGIGNYKEIQEVVKNIFVSNKLSHETASISVLNGTSKSGLATRVSEKIKNANLNVINTGSADSGTYAKTIIYDYTNGAKPATISYLETLLGVKSQTKEKGNGTGDIEIILGRDYTE